MFGSLSAGLAFSNASLGAVHAMRDRGGRLVVMLREATLEEGREKGLPRMDAEAYLQLVVQDTGQGIPPTIMDRIFDPFFTTKEHTAGTGMGLSVAHGIIKSHGGLIDVESQVGRGTTFHIYLPKIMPRAKAHHHNALPLPSGSERVLLVDDETITEETAQRIGIKAFILKPIVMNDLAEIMRKVLDSPL
jgi:hypothetical protein